MEMVLSPIQHKTFYITTAAGVFIFIFMYMTSSNFYRSQQNIVLTPVEIDENPGGQRLLDEVDSCTRLLSSPSSFVNQSEFRIQLLAAVPGSGSKWCRTSIALLTGYTTSAVGYFQEHSKHRILNETLRRLGRPLYFKTHFPYFITRGATGKELNNNPDRVVVLIRHPFDAGFSEFVRETAKRRAHKHYSRDDKYHGIQSGFNASDFFSQSGIKTKPSLHFKRFYNHYLKAWVSFHRYWLQKYQGNLKVMFYSDMVKDERLFSDIAAFFGYLIDTNPQSQRRTECFYENYALTTSAKRPRVPLIEESKEKLRTMLADATAKKVILVENLYFNKYQQRYEIL